MPRSRNRPEPGVSCTAVHDGRGRLLLVLAIAGLAILALAPIAAARSSPIPTPRFASSGSVRAGQVVEITWDALPPGIPEMELMLSVDGGRHFPIRMTAEMSGLETSFSWKVPNLGVQKARILLRANLDGIETESEPGPEFTIVFDPDLPAELEQVHEGDWWEGVEEIDVPAGLIAAGPSVHAGSAPRDGDAPRRDPRFDAPPSSAISTLPVAAVRAGTTPAHIRSTAPLFRPRRE